MGKEAEPEQKQENPSPTAGMSVEAKRIFWSRALEQLTAFPRFIDWFDKNYEAGVHKDDENGTVDIIVRERPPAEVSPITGQQIFKIWNLATLQGCREPRVLVEQILKVLGHGGAVIVPADERDLKRIVGPNDPGPKHMLDDE